MLVDTVIKKGNNERQMRKYGPIVSALVQGRLGVDLFLIVFAVAGLLAIPGYFLLK